MLVKDILKLGTEDLPPSVSLVRDIASSIYKARGRASVGVN